MSDEAIPMTAKGIKPTTKNAAMNLTLSGGLNYREDRFTQQANRLDKVLSASAGLSYDYGRWLIFSLMGQYLQRNSTLDTENYDNSQAVLTVTLRDKLQ